MKMPAINHVILILKMFWFFQDWKLQTRDGSLVKDRVWQEYAMIIMPGLLCPAVPHGWREVRGSAVWRPQHAT